MRKEDKKKILIIDDEKDISSGTKMSLEKTGAYIVKEENDPANAVNAAKEFNPDVILLDIMMPDIDGGEIARQLKAEEKLKNIPVIFLTGAVKKDEIGNKAANIGGHLFIAKPVRVENLVDSIDKSLGR